MTLENLEQQLQSLPKGSRFILRDDLYDLTELEQILEKATARKLKIALLDSGKLAPADLERLADFPFSFYTSDAARADFEVLSQMALALKQKDCQLGLFIRGELESGSALFANLELFDSIFASGREKAQPLDQLGRLAEEISRSSASLVYYHHQKPEENLASIGLKNCWLHLSSRNFNEDSEIMILDLLKNIRKNKGRLVVHIDHSLSYPFLKELEEAGAFLVFNLPPVEPASRISRLVETWQKKKLPEKAFYLYKEIMA
ncbi:MAG: hypothetical protein ACUVRL_00730 [Candidatus Saccharicenans sp.]|uniref:hypothetical protein n=1 Tax=Candidatus Saccharicenans sp. TaxID=2819258 RepID=UPI0040495E12